MAKFNVKDFDFKQFFLRHGEWVGLAVAAAIMVPAFVMGVMNVFTAGSATANAADMATRASTANRRIDESIPPEDAAKPPVEGGLEVRNDRVKPYEYVPDLPWFVPSTMEDNKRRAPVVFAPADFQSIVLRGGMMGHIYATTGTTMRVLVIREKQSPLSDRDKKNRDRKKKLMEYLQKQGGMGMGGMGMGGMGMGGRGMGGMGMGGRGMGGMGMGGMGMGGRGMGGMGMGGMGMGGMGGAGPEGGGMGNMGAGASRQTVKRSEWVDLDKIGDNQDAHFAQELNPVRMVIVNGTFPFKDQLDAFRVGLRKRTLSDVIAGVGPDSSAEIHFEFAPFEIERRTYDLDGKLVKDWETRYDQKMLDALRMALARAVDVEPEDQEYSKFWGLKNKGILWKRPKLELPFNPSEESSRYPAVEIASLKEAIQALEKIGVDNTPKPKTRAQIIAGGGIDPTDPDNAPGTEDEKKMVEETGNKPADAENKNKSDPNADDAVAPAKAPIRFIDMTVEPGHVYEYRVRTKMYNPNFKKVKEVAYPALAKSQFIFGEWVTVPRVTVPFETNWYIADDRLDKERLNVQIHKWLEDTPLDEKTKDPQRVAVADWTILEKSAAATCFRGEYIGRTDNVQVPMWSVQKEEWEFAGNSRRVTSKRVPVDFQVKPDNRYQYPTMLLDFDGGKKEARVNGKVVTDDAPIQALVMTPEGKLEIRRNTEDKEDHERVQRYDNWKKRLDEVKNPTQKKSKQNNLFEGKGPLN